MAVMGLLLLPAGCKKDVPVDYGTLQLVRTRIGTVYLDLNNTVTDVPVENSLFIEFSSAIDSASAVENIVLADESGKSVALKVFLMDNGRTIRLDHATSLAYSTNYILTILEDLRGAAKETFPGVEYKFTTEEGRLVIEQITLNNIDFKSPEKLTDIDYQDISMVIDFSDALDPGTYRSFIIMSGSPSLNYSLAENNSRVIITNTADLKDYTKYYFTISPNLQSVNGYPFSGFSNNFFTSLDSTYKFPELTDDALLDLVQQQTFRYFYDFAHPVSGMARERNTSGNTVTTGGSGFGMMALIVGMERQFITREQGLAHIDKVLNFLETCDRFHGAWPHWLNGNTGDVQPFGTKDNGADLVETAYMIQGLITLRQYLDDRVTAEKDLITRIDTLWHQVEWDWFTRGGQDVLYWHWSPNYLWDMNMQIRGYNETLITYVLAGSSPTHAVPASVYHKGYARDGGIINGKTFYGITLPLGYDYGGPLFFAHYSFLGLDPRDLSDQYASYWEQNVNHTLINRAHCREDPYGYIGYSADCWGLTASDGNEGYSAHSPTNDRGVITPTAALSSMPYTPEYSMDALRHFYYLLGNKLWGNYGFYDAFNITENWWADSFLAIDQGPIVVMIENYRTGLLWDLFMSAPEIQSGLTKLGFTY